MSSNNNDPYDASHVYRAWNKLREEKRNESDSSTYKLESIAGDRYDNPDVRRAAASRLLG